jgi:hypothetical protein
MANIIGPFGLSQWGTASGPPNFAESHNTPYRIAAGNATAIFYGDLVRLNTSGPTGYIQQWANGAGTANVIVSGVFVGCDYFSTSQQKRIWNRYWPGSDATGDVNAYVVDDPSAQFMIQGDTTVAAAITQTSLGLVADVVVNAGNTVTGISGMALAAPTTSTTGFLPLKVVNLVTTPPGANGTDLTTVGNYVVVAFNNQTYKTITGSV